MGGPKALSKQATFPSVLYLEHEQPRFLYSSSLLCKYGKEQHDVGSSENLGGE